MTTTTPTAPTKSPAPAAMGSAMQCAGRLDVLAEVLAAEARRAADAIRHESDMWVGLGRAHGQRTDDARDTLQRCDEALNRLTGKVAIYRAQLAASIAAH